MNQFISIITSTDSLIRNSDFFEICKSIRKEDLLENFFDLDNFRKTTANLYEKVRASIFLYSGYRFILMESGFYKNTGTISPDGFKNFLNRNYEKAISIFLAQIKANGPDSNIFSCLAENYHHLTFKILAEQVKKSVRSSPGNQWMFRVGHHDEQPLKIHPRLLERKDREELFPILVEKTAVRMDLTHSAWSDIFFLGMDYPEGAKVINVSVDLGIFGRDEDIKPPIETYLRVISEPLIRITSIDLNDTKDISLLSDLFNFGNDYLSLLKAAIIASGFIPSSFEGTSHSIKSILENIISPGFGIEIVTKVNNIPKGSRLAVSTNLLASIISALMRATQQTSSLDGKIKEQERRLIASRAILGEWLGGSGGGWQDSGGIWNGIKKIEGAFAKENDPEFNISRGCLLPKHKVLSDDELSKEFDISSSLVLMHGGMASNVGPILEMVTEKYLLRTKDKWKARQEAIEIYNKILETLSTGNIKELADLTTRNFNGPIQTIIPWATNHYTQTIINRVSKKLGSDYWGFVMLGGMSGGGMGMFVNPKVLNTAKGVILEVLTETKKELSSSLPFAMDPVVYNFKVNNTGSFASLLESNNALMPDSYYSLQIPLLVKSNIDSLSQIRKREIDLATSKTTTSGSFNMLRAIVCKLFNFTTNSGSSEIILNNEETDFIKKSNGFDYIQHEQIRQDLIKGRIGLSRNRLPVETVIENVSSTEITKLEDLKDVNKLGKSKIEKGNVAVMCLAGGLGSRWTTGAGVIKALHPFIEMEGTHRSFIEIHLAKNKKTALELNTKIPVIVATSYLTHAPIKESLEKRMRFGYNGDVYLSPGKSIGQRFIPMERDLKFLWEELPQEQLDENKQKVRASVRAAMISWAKNKGEGKDYSDNISHQRLNPLGHWFEVPNLIRNGVLSQLLIDHPQVDTIMLHNVDTLGANVNPEILNYHLQSENVLTFEVVPRRMDDRGGGLAKINGKIRLLEGLAQPHDEDELSLSYYNTMTTWINIDKLLNVFKLTRADLINKSEEEISEAIRELSKRIPTYVTIKDVKYRWGHGQEDIYPVAQVEKLWGDMSALPDVKCGYVVVPRSRGQQLKDISQLDAWVNDGSKDYINSLCNFAG